MRVRMQLQLKNPENANVLPINYQYEFSSWFLKNLSQGRGELGDFLCDLGFDSNGHGFRLFTFSNPYIPKLHQIGDRLYIKSDAISIIFSTVDIPGFFNPIYSHFLNQEFSIGDPFSRVGFRITEIKRLRDPEFSNCMEFKCISPILLSQKKKIQTFWNNSFLKPGEMEYDQFFFESLKRKYQTLCDLGIAEWDGLESGPMELNLRSQPKSRLITIKAHTPEETRLRGFIYSFQVKAPAGLLRTAYNTGFGELGSLGFGCVVPEK